MKIIISGGGSGGHIFPALAIAGALKERGVNDILFVGAEGKIEMEKVPAAGYPIEGLNISGFHRGEFMRNLKFPIRLLNSLLKAKKIIEKFKPDIVIGVGGFASGPVLKVAQWKAIPTLIQEQNSYPGITNKLLAGKADRICVAYENMDRYFPGDKIVMTGNPVRKDLENAAQLREEAIGFFGLDQNKKTLLIFGGSLGARSINRALYADRERIAEQKGVQMIWQAGKIYFDEYSQTELAKMEHIKILPFIDRMDLAYSAADLVVCRAGALTISELAIVGKPAILLPSPNVAEDHQTRNAAALVSENAARMLKDSQAEKELWNEAMALLNDDTTRKSLSENIKRMARPHAGAAIVDEIFKLSEK